jgi:hypothetical protein
VETGDWMWSRWLCHSSLLLKHKQDSVNGLLLIAHFSRIATLHRLPYGRGSERTGGGCRRQAVGGGRQAAGGGRQAAGRRAAGCYRTATVRETVPWLFLHGFLHLRSRFGSILYMSNLEQLRRGCMVDTVVHSFLTAVRRQEWRRGTQECVRRVCRAGFRC